MPLIIGLMVAASSLAIAAKRVRIPYNVALVVGGLLISVGGVLRACRRSTRRSSSSSACRCSSSRAASPRTCPTCAPTSLPIAMLATLGMVLAIAATGTALHYTLALAWGPALLLGAMLAVTDTVSILYAFRRAPVPRRLSGIMQGESLFNDGTALVAYARHLQHRGGRRRLVLGADAQRQDPGSHPGRAGHRPHAGTGGRLHHPPHRGSARGDHGDHGAGLRRPSSSASSCTCRAPSPR